METLLRQIVRAYQSVTKVQHKYRIQDLADWINANGGWNGYRVSRRDVLRGIAMLLEKEQKK